MDRRTKSSALYEDYHLTFRCVWARTHHVEKGQGFKKYMIGQHIIALFIINKTEALSICIPFHLQKQLFHYGYDFRPHVSEENAHENFSKTFSRVELFHGCVDRRKRNFSKTLRTHYQFQPTPRNIRNFFKMADGRFPFCLLYLGLFLTQLLVFKQI